MMNVGRTMALAITAWVWASSLAYAQGFSSGSNGSFGPINVTQGTVALDMPADGIFHSTTITVAQDATLKFNRNPLNTPVFLLATGDITVNGTIDVSGEDGTQFIGGRGGPGGFDGGAPGILGGAPGAGHGPGGGLGGEGSRGTSDSVGGGSYGGVPSPFPGPRDGKTYGSPLLVPLAGGSGGGGVRGSGGGGVPDLGGGGGGGAILLASNTRVQISGAIRALGGNTAGFKGGSGGAIRIVCPIVSGIGALDVRSGSSSLDLAGDGRIRIDVIDRSTLTLNFLPMPSVGSFLLAFPDVIPRLDIIDVAGQQITEGTAAPVLVTLPFGSSPSRTVTVQARDFTGIVPIDVVLTPDSGDPTIFPAQIDMNTGNPAQVTVNVQFLVNVTTSVNAWTR